MTAFDITADMAETVEVLVTTDDGRQVVYEVRRDPSAGPAPSHEQERSFERSVEMETSGRATAP